MVLKILIPKKVLYRLVGYFRLLSRLSFQVLL